MANPDYDPGADVVASPTSRVLEYLSRKGISPSGASVRAALVANAQNPGLIPGLVNEEPPTEDAAPALRARGGGGGSRPASNTGTRNVAKQVEGTGANAMPPGYGTPEPTATGANAAPPGYNSDVGSMIAAGAPLALLMDRMVRNARGNMDLGNAVNPNSAKPITGSPTTSAPPAPAPAPRATSPIASALDRGGLGVVAEPSVTGVNPVNPDILANMRTGPAGNASLGLNPVPPDMVASMPTGPSATRPVSTNDIVPPPQAAQPGATPLDLEEYVRQNVTPKPGTAFSQPVSPVRRPVVPTDVPQISPGMRALMDALRLSGKAIR